MYTHMHLTDLLAEYEDGNAAGWPSEFGWLWTEDGPAMLELVADILARGIQKPILLGADGSIWDGHHRIAAAVALGIHVVPVTTEVSDAVD